MRAAVDAAVIEGLRGWAERNAGEVVKPTGIRMRNLNPIITATDAWAEAWWGYLVGGKAASFASINTRSERLASGKGPVGARAIVPATYWREMQQPQRVWHHLDLDGRLFGMAAVTRPGVTADGAEFTCYSLVMRPAAEQIEGVHDRMPLLVPASFTEEWLHSDEPAGVLIDAAVDASEDMSAAVQAHPQDDVGRLF